jgi:TP901-1 family phage major tail protein
MAIEKGSAFLLKIGDGNTTPTYTVVAGLRTTHLSINAESVNVTNKGSGAWRELLSAAGVRSVSISGSGVFTNSAAETRLRSKALSAELDEYEIAFEASDKMRGKFQVAKLEYSGDYNGERTYQLTLESSGVVSFSA